MDSLQSLLYVSNIHISGFFLYFWATIVDLFSRLNPNLNDADLDGKEDIRRPMSSRLNAMQQPQPVWSRERDAYKVLASAITIHYVKMNKTLLIVNLWLIIWINEENG